MGAFGVIVTPPWRGPEGASPLILGSVCVPLWRSGTAPGGPPQRSSASPGLSHPLPGIPARKPFPQAPNSTMSQNYDQMVEAISACREDVEKAEAGNKAATSRVRKSMQEIKALAQELRKEMLELRDSGGSQG